MANIHAHHKGRSIVTTEPVVALAEGFPGWGAPNYADFLVTLDAGVRGRITDVESHGAAPYTRYCIAFEDGSSASGVAPASVRFVRGAIEEG